MHGHGSKPHLCSYSDCDRSIPGNGFPRRYNLFDHMKRVHDFTGSTTPPDRASPPAVTPVIAAKRPNPRKRKSTGAVEESVSEKRHKPLPTKSASTPAVPVISAETRRAMERQQLDAEWTKLKASVIQRIQELPSLTDMAAHEAAAGEWSAFFNIAQRAHELG